MCVCVTMGYRPKALLSLHRPSCPSVCVCVFVYPEGQCVSVWLSSSSEARSLSQTTVLTEGSDRLSWPVMSVGYGYRESKHTGYKQQHHTLADPELYPLMGPAYIPVFI